MTQSLDAVKQKNEELLAANEAASQKLLKISSQHEQALKNMSNEQAKRILDLKNELIEKETLCEQLSLAKKNVGDERKQNVSMENVPKCPEVNEKVNNVEQLASCSPVIKKRGRFGGRKGQETT